MPEQERYNVEFFVCDFDGNRESCGEYETFIEDCVLSVELPQFLEVSDLQRFEIEFSGKVPE